MSGERHPKPPSTFQLNNDSGGALVGGTAVIVTANGGFDHPAAGAGAIGVLLFDSAADGDPGAIAEPGQVVEVTSGAAFSAGDRLAADAVGKFVTATVGNHVIAHAIGAAGAADELVEAIFIGGHPVEPA